MLGFRLSAQRPPDARRVNDDVVMRFDHVYEIDPRLMTEHVSQQDLPNWEIHRIVASRWEHLAWMHDHFGGRLRGELLRRSRPRGERTVPAGLALQRRSPARVGAGPPGPARAEDP
jgi:hypothetical protein